MSTAPELEEIPPSSEVQREMALEQISFFQHANSDYRQLAALIHKHPSRKRMARFSEICGTVQNSSEPLIESKFYRDIDPNLVVISVDAIIEELRQNRELAATLEGDTYADDEFDEEFRQGLIAQVLSDEIETEGENAYTPVIVESPVEQLSPKDLIRFMGGMHECTIKDILENLEESSSVQAGLEHEYVWQERKRTALVGLVAFAGALGGSLAAGKINRNK